MSAIASTPTDAEAKNATMSARLFFLDLSAGRILSANPDAPIEDHHHRRPEVPDGPVLDVAAGHVYWANPNAQQGQMLKRRPI